MLVLQILVAIAAIILIVSVMLQKSDSDGVSALTGGNNSDTFFGKNQTSTLEGKLALITKISAGVFVVLAIVIMIVS